MGPLPSLATLTAALFPPACPLCGAHGSALCAACVDGLEPAGRLRVEGLDTVAALVRFEGAGATLVKRLKYARRRDAVGVLGEALAALVDARPQAVTWVPTTAARRRARGFDQAEVLARAVARHLGAPARCLLRRTDEGSQTARGRAERLASAGFGATGTVPAAVLVVDDVCTTGASLRAAAAALRGAGALEVSGATLAATP
jgi:predicted amidophosphoribosyltransferase